jgi:hypothetical protein
MQALIVVLLATGTLAGELATFPFLSAFFQ